MKTDLDNAIGVVPPSPIDLDSLISRERRRSRVLRLGLTGSATAGVVAVAVTAAMFAAGGGAPPDGGFGASAEPTTSPSPTGSHSPSGGPRPTNTSDSDTGRPTHTATPPNAAQGEATAERLTGALRAAVRAQAPTMTARGNDVSPDPLRFKRVYREGDPDTTPADYFLASAIVADATGAGEVLVTVGRDDPNATPPAGKALPGSGDDGCANGAPVGQDSCDATTGADGSRIVRRTLRGEGGVRQNAVVVTRPGGVRIRLVAANNGGQADTGPTTRTEPVLTLAQLVAIGTDPGLTVTP